MSSVNQTPSARRDELLERAYAYGLRHGLADVSLRPLAAAIESSPRVLLFLFGNKDGLTRALLERARVDELELIARLRTDSYRDLGAVARPLWQWLAASEHRALLRLWVEAYGRSLIDPKGPWGGFAQRTVDDWLQLLSEAQPPRRRASRAGRSERTLVLALLRGAMLDLLATDDEQRVTAAVHAQLDARFSPRPRRG